jgi:hypothetical protein
VPRTPDVERAIENLRQYVIAKLDGTAV